MKTIRIFVTKKDIENGRTGDASSCPIALATKRRFSKKCSVFVYNGAINISVYNELIDPYNNLFLNISVERSKTQGFIRRFDSRDLSIKPVRIKAEVPSKLEQYLKK